jgi:hypothetical protein
MFYPVRPSDLSPRGEGGGGEDGLEEKKENNINGKNKNKN